MWENLLSVYRWSGGALLLILAIWLGAFGKWKHLLRAGVHPVPSHRSGAQLRRDVAVLPVTLAGTVAGGMMIAGINLTQWQLLVFIATPCLVIYFAAWVVGARLLRQVRQLDEVHEKIAAAHGGVFDLYAAKVNIPGFGKRQPVASRVSWLDGSWMGLARAHDGPDNSGVAHSVVWASSGEAHGATPAELWDPAVEQHREGRLQAAWKDVQGSGDGLSGTRLAFGGDALTIWCRPYKKPEDAEALLSLGKALAAKLGLSKS